QYETVPADRILDKSIQLAIGKCSCSSLTELYIGLCVKNTGLPEFFHIPLSFTDRSAPFQNERTYSRKCKQIRAEQSRRTASHYQRTIRQGFCAVFRNTVSLFTYILYFVFHMAEYHIFYFRVEVNGIYVEELRLFSCIERTFPYRVTDQVVRSNPEGLCQPFSQLLFCVLDWKFELFDTQHI